MRNDLGADVRVGKELSILYSAWFIQSIVDRKFVRARSRIGALALQCRLQWSTCMV